ncbi:MAG: RNA polymerase sigma factor [Armatimonadota bacterium]
MKLPLRSKLPLEQTDEELVQAIQRRMRRSAAPDLDTEFLFRELYRRHISICHAVVSRKVHQDDVEDVLVEIWTAVWKAICSGQRVEKFSGLLRTVVRSKIADAVEARRKARARSFGAGPLEDEWMDAPEGLLIEGWADADSSDPEAEFLRAEEAERMKTLLMGLHRPWRLAIQCRLSLQMSVRETAERLGVSEGAVKKYVARGLKALRRLMESDQEYWGNMLSEDEETCQE